MLLLLSYSSPANLAEQSSARATSSTRAPFRRLCSSTASERWLESGRFNGVDYYYDVRRSEWLYQGGHANLARRPPSEAVRLYTAWEAECQRVWRQEGRYPTLEEQCAFFGVPYQPGAAGSSGASNG